MKKLLTILLPLLTIACLVFIFWGSLQPGPVSAARSSRVARFVAAQLEKISGKPVDAERVDPVIRKLTHCLEFALFALLLTFSLRVRRESFRGVPYRALFFSLLAAVCDETIQRFVVGRSSEVTDVLIDFSGALFGFGAALLTVRLFTRKTRRRKRYN